MNSNFFILTAPRSGSTVLVRTLDQHLQIFCAGEIFHPADKIYHAEWHFPFWGTKKKKGFSRKIFAIANYVNGYFFAVKHIKKFYAAKEGNESVRGFKLMIGHVKDFPTVLNYLRQNDFKIIVLTRRNTFREALSSFRARQTGVFHTQTDADILEKKVYVNPSLLKKRVDELEAINRSIRQLSEGMRRIVIEYEDFNDWQGTLNKLFSFLNVERIEMDPVLTKTSSDDWRRDVENFGEIEIALRDTYARYLD
jgi:LPS sulfotransferase NodH